MKYMLETMDFTTEDFNFTYISDIGEEIELL
jgi:hypothetical protein